ncbi:uncharacterized protein ACB057_010819 [Neosynchiropus ocellatus]
MPTPALLTTADAAKRPKKKPGPRTAPKSLKKDQKRAETRINIGDAFQQWRELRESLGLLHDWELADVLLDREPGGEAENGGNIPTPVAPSEPSHQLSGTEEVEPSSEDEDVSSQEKDIDDSEDPDYTPEFDGFVNPKKQKVSAPSTQEGATGGTARPSSPSEERIASEAESLQPPRSRHKPKTCHICRRVLRNGRSLRRHLLVHTGEKPFKCFICARGFNQKGNLKTHMKVHEGETTWILREEKHKPKPPPAPVNLCGDCGMDFPEPQQLEKHREVHRKPYSCDACGKSFKCPRYLEKHSTIHTGELPFGCETCAKRFFTAALLRVHMLRHTGKKSFHCKLCKKSFWLRHKLRTHLLTHSGQRPHLCAVCGKSYAQAATLKIHLRVHTGETPYLCSICGKAFYYPQGYHQHLQVHNKNPKVRAKPLGRPKRNLSSDS